MQKTPPNCKVGLGEMFLVVCNLQSQHCGNICTQTGSLCAGHCHLCQDVTFELIDCCALYVFPPQAVDSTQFENSSTLPHQEKSFSAEVRVINVSFNLAGNLPIAMKLKVTSQYSKINLAEKKMDSFSHEISWWQLYHSQVRNIGQNSLTHSFCHDVRFHMKSISRHVQCDSNFADFLIKVLAEMIG